ncbi:PD-(D/E)XK nuclease superfamily protein [Desulfobotulus alkaliphilus]|uniref:PD-(D/E)XK nuclease superfamily protein n=1 Tax=Desulfobotulus alkaliphilus TaxID=622671 RepID=A0A562RYN8_9BACT|nr:AAA family ATPase [Desulfobotulus alkaliphilus]TWI74008.1 PD-(D/E)XK nuclease superfamily protein [Desulfobotulus alkaliphilus]
MKKRILYGEANYAAIVRENGYFVDKTAYIEKLESVKNTVFLRPRRFGKSLLCTMLESYYSVLYKDNFEELFGHTWIGKNPTPLHNTLLVLHLDFSTIETGELEVMEKSFNHTVNLKLKSLIRNCHAWLKNSPPFDPEASATANLQSLLDHFSPDWPHPLYVIIDEYDNFANQLITGHKDLLYKQLMADDGFLKTFFKLLKEGRKTGAIHNVFITGVLPVTMDELASGFNIATFITLNPKFENMIGFTQSEVDLLLDDIYKDYDIRPDTRNEVQDVIKNQYNGYHFINPEGEAVYNSTILQYFLSWLCEFKTMPKHLTDMNLKTDILWIKRITGSNPELTEDFVTRLTTENSIDYDDTLLTQKFNMSQFFEKGFFPISFFYLGMLTRKNDFSLTLPNLNMRRIFVEYFNELHRIDVSTGYGDMMQHFVKTLDLKALFAGYWQEYVSQLPEAVFTKVNENFYRTTFYELCSRYLSRWFTWNVERSYPKGRTDLEFVGKFNECFAGIRMVIEFKYFSNAAFKKFNTSIENFTLIPEDTEQMAGYVEGLQKEYPEARVSQHVIYCFGNGGFRVFDTAPLPASNEPKS